ncbi:MAG: phage head-tail connector protein [Ruminococcus sp.]|nr:phage head-tail connector protein [Ruminococcus sp.]
MSQIQMLRVMTEETDEAVLNTYLHLAGSKITARCYPFEPHRPVPPKYSNLQVEIAAYLINKRGADGQLTHSENGISRTYESASVPESMLKDVTPHVGVFGGSADEMP